MISKTIYCTKHKYTPMDVWYDCQNCSEEADTWAIAKGFSQAVSPGNDTIENSDQGEWLKTQTVDRYAWISYPVHPVVLERVKKIHDL